MSRYDGLIIPRSYSEYINKTDAATLLQALQLSGVMDNAPTANSVHPVKSGGIYSAIINTDAPIGSLIMMYKKTAPNNYLYCDGSTFDAATYPALYAYLGSNTLPDYREYAPVGAEQNTTDTIAAHDVYAQGEGKDDQLQNITGTYRLISDMSFIPPSDSSGTGAIVGVNERGPHSTSNSADEENRNIGFDFDASRVARAGTVTRGKRKAVYFYIKAA